MPEFTDRAQIDEYRDDVNTIDKARVRVENDIFYKKCWPFWSDMKIVALTVQNVVSRCNAR
jgi:lipopolysaccharide/colanic/teichoic acid biosynthesis glycosyltransferase